MRQKSCRERPEHMNAVLCDHCHADGLALYAIGSHALGLKTASAWAKMAQKASAEIHPDEVGQKSLN
jgi:hypothetical protein